jgi:hypothetical protein
MNIGIARLIDNRGRIREILTGRFITAPADDRLRRDENNREPDYPASSAVPQTAWRHGSLRGARYCIEMSHARDDITDSALPAWWRGLYLHIAFMKHRVEYPHALRAYPNNSLYYPVRFIGQEMMCMDALRSSVLRAEC